MRDEDKSKAELIAELNRLREQAGEGGVRRLGDFADISNDWFWEIGPDYRFTWVSGQFEAQFGVPGSSLTGKLRSEVCAQELNPKEYMEAHEEMLRSHEPFRDFRYWWQPPEGTPRYLSVSGMPVFSPDGEFLGYRGTGSDITASRRTEDALRDHQRLLEEVLNAIPLSITLKDVHRRYRMGNAQSGMAYGLGGARIVNRSFDDIEEIPPAVRAKIREYDLKVLETGVIQDYLEKGQGEASGRVFRKIKSPLRDGQGRVNGIVTVTEDITPRHKAEELVLEKQHLLQTVLDAMPLAITLKDRNLRYLMANRKVFETYGLSDQAQIIGKTYDGLPGVNPEVIDRVEKYDRLVLETGEIHEDDDFRLIKGQGAIFVRNIKVPFKDHRGEITGIVSIGQNITERKQAELALRESEEKLRAFLEHSPLPISLKDHEGRFVLVNRQFINDSHHKNAADYLGKTVEDVLGADQSVELKAMDAEVLTTREAVNRELRIPLGGKGLRDCLLSKFPVFASDGSISHIGTIYSDVSDYRQLEHQLRETEKMDAIGQLAGGIAHEFNNAMQVILNSVEFIKMKNGDPDKVLEYAGMIARHAEHTTMLTSELLGFSRKGLLMPSPLDVNALIERQCRIAVSQDGGLLRIQKELDPDVHRALGDEGVLEHVLLHLFVNARDAMPNGGQLLVSSGNTRVDDAAAGRVGLPGAGDYVQLTISDTGQGMPAEVMERIFEPFYTTKEVGKGTGLGLAMVYGAMQQHKGAVQVESTLNAGTTFRLYLPAVDVAGPDVSAPREEARSHGSETILLAEDEPDVRELLCNFLEGRGYRVIAAENGQEAWERFRENPEGFDLVLLDMMMPVLNGRGAYEKIRGLSRDIPVVFSTGYSTDAVDTSFFQGEELRLMHKPYSPKALLAVVRETLDARG